MLLLKANSETVKEFPKELVSRCMANQNGIARTLQKDCVESAVQNGGLTSTSVANEVVPKPTLFEMSDPQQGVLYDTFDIRAFQMDPTLKNGNLNTYVSLTTPASKITLSADIIHVQDQKILDVIPEIAVVNNSYLELNQAFGLDSSLDGTDLAALVYANWTNTDGTIEQLSMLYQLNHGDERLKYQHQRPSTADHGVVIGTPLNMTYNEDIKADVNGDHIVVSLYRKPDDMSDVNYVCGFGLKGNNVSAILT